MPVSFVLAVQTSWARMLRVLFRPFRFETWLVMGFAAFLSDYLSSPGGGGGGGRWQGLRHGGRHAGAPGLPHLVRDLAAFLLHPVWGAIAIAIVALILSALLLLLWLSSRGKFVLLDDVVRERAAIVEPWTRYGRLGDSLFAFRVGFAMVAIAGGLALSLPVLPGLLAAVAAGGDWHLVAGALALWWVLAMLPFILLAACVHLLLHQFVVPIMYRDGLGVLAAWRRFGTLFGARPLAFIGYALLFLVVLILALAAIVVLGVFSCCVGFLLLAIPYVGSVVTLPLSVTLRGLGPDYLAQFGPEWSVYPAGDTPQAGA